MSGFKTLSRISSKDLETSGRASLATNPPGVLPYKCEEGAHREISRKPLKGTRILFYGRVPNLFPSPRGTNSTSTNHITGTVNFNSNKDNFRTLSSQGLFDSIVINLYLAAVILGFSTQSCTNPKI